MAEASNKIKILEENLNDAGFKRSQIECFIKCFLCRNWNKIQELIIKQRKELLNSLHQTRNQIDCLDYLMYQIKKEKL